MKSFIVLTEDQKLKSSFEKETKDAYGDLVRILFHHESLFPISTSLLRKDMSEIVQQASGS
jgi:hypothetical protein